MHKNDNALATKADITRAIEQIEEITRCVDRRSADFRRLSEEAEHCMNEALTSRDGRKDEAIKELKRHFDRARATIAFDCQRRRRRLALAERSSAVVSTVHPQTHTESVLRLPL